MGYWIFDKTIKYKILDISQVHLQVCLPAPQGHLGGILIALD